MRRHVLCTICQKHIGFVHGYQVKAVRLNHVRHSHQDVVERMRPLFEQYQQAATKFFDETGVSIQFASILFRTSGGTNETPGPDNDEG